MGRKIPVYRTFSDVNFKDLPVSTHRARRYYLFFRRNMSTSGPPYIMRVHGEIRILYVMYIVHFIYARETLFHSHGKKICEIRLLCMQTSAAIEKDIRKKKQSHNRFREIVVLYSVYLPICTQHIWKICEKKCVHDMPKITNEEILTLQCDIW